MHYTGYIKAFFIDGKNLGNAKYNSLCHLLIHKLRFVDYVVVGGVVVVLICIYF